MAEITGRHVLATTVCAFGVIIAVNVLMAWKAVSTFPGLEVANSYVASQEFNERRDAQLALGWTLSHLYAGDRVKIAFTTADGTPVQVRDLAVLIGRTTEAAEDIRPDFHWQGDHYEAAAALAPGVWMIRVTAHAADGTLFEHRSDFTVGG